MQMIGYKSILKVATWNVNLIQGTDIQEVTTCKLEHGHKQSPINLGMDVISCKILYTLSSLKVSDGGSVLMYKTVLLDFVYCTNYKSIKLQHSGSWVLLLSSGKRRKRTENLSAGPPG
jgi:hypothetical protein